MLKGYRTLAFNSLVAILGVAQTFDWTTVLGSSTAGMVVTGIGVAGMVLRTVTDTPVGNSQSNSK